MANDPSAFLVAPRCYTKHQRHRKNPADANVGAGSRNQFAAFLATEATRLSVTDADIFDALPRHTADAIRAADQYSGTLS